MHLITLLLTSAFAGNITEGPRQGVTWGHHDTVPDLPGECQYPDTHAIIICQETVAGVPIQTAYGWEQNLLYVAVVTGKGYATCNQLFSVLVEAWGKPIMQPNPLHEPLPDAAWLKGKVKGSWKYNKFSDECEGSLVSLKDLGVLQKSKDEKAKQEAAGF
jgi:hypothetical protein